MESDIYKNPSEMTFKEIAPGISMAGLSPFDSASLDYILVEDASVEHMIIHRETDEIIFILEGELEASVGGEERTLRKNDTTVIRRGTPHCFINKSGNAVKLLSICSPGYDPKDVVVVEG